MHNTKLLDYSQVQSFPTDKAAFIEGSTGNNLLILQGIEECKGLGENDDWDVSPGVIVLPKSPDKKFFGLDIKLKHDRSTQWRQRYLFFDWNAWGGTFNKLLACQIPGLFLSADQFDLTETEFDMTRIMAKIGGSGHSIILPDVKEWKKFTTTLDLCRTTSDLHARCGKGGSD